MLVFLSHGFKGHGRSVGARIGGGGMGPVWFRPEVQIEGADQDSHMDESVSLPCCRQRDESKMCRASSRRKLSLDRRYRARRVIIAGTCGCENARSRNAQAGVRSGTGHFFLRC